MKYFLFLVYKILLDSLHPQIVKERLINWFVFLIIIINKLIFSVHIYKKRKPNQVKLRYTIFCHNTFWVPEFWPHTHTDTRKQNQKLIHVAEVSCVSGIITPFWQRDSAPFDRWTGDRGHGTGGSFRWKGLGYSAKRGTPSRPLSTCSTTFRQRLVLTHWKLLR